MHKVLPEDTEPLELADAQRGGASAQVAAAAARPEAGSAEWHAALIRRALERDAAKLISRGSQRLGSAQSSRSSGFVTPGRIGLGSREGIRKGYTLANLRASTAAIDDMLSNEGRAQTAQTARGAIQTPPHSERLPKDGSWRWPGKPANHRPSTTSNPRETRIKQWQAMESRISPRSRSRALSSSPEKKLLNPLHQSDKSMATTRSLQGFKQYFDDKPITRVEEVPGPGSVQSASVESYIEIGDSDMSDDELLDTLAQRANVPKPKIPQAERFKIARRTQRLDEHRREPKLPGAAFSSHPAKQGTISEPEFNSAGLYVHTELERLRTVDESRKNLKPEEARVAHCCSLLERLQVKYFDEELAMLKEELFFAIFSDFEVLKQKPVPRAREAFFEAKPFFVLLDLERQKVEELELQIKRYSDEALNYKEMNRQLESRLKFQAELQRGGETGDMGGGGAGASTNGARFEGEASLSESMLRGSMSRQSSARRQDSWRAPASHCAGHDKNWPIYGPASILAHQTGDLLKDSSQASFRASSRNMQSQHGHAGRILPLDKTGSLSALDRASTSHPEKSMTQNEKQKNNPFLSAFPSVKLVASEINNLETYLTMYRASLSVEQQDKSGAQESSAHTQPSAGDVSLSTQVHRKFEAADSKAEVTWGRSFLEKAALDHEEHSTRPPPGHTLILGGQKLRRRKGTAEARWRDFAVYLSRHPEACVTRREGLQTVYDKWRLPLDYKATFASMLRALERHDQLHLDPTTGIEVIYSPSLGQDLADVASSDEEEDLEEVISSRDKRLLKLQQEKGALQSRLEAELETQNDKLERRMSELELHSDSVFETAQKRFEEKVQTLQEKIEELHGHLSVKEGELKKVQYLLQDSGSLAATAQKLKEDGEAAQVRAQRREKQLLEQAEKDQETIAHLMKQLDVANVIQGTVKEQIKIKTGFSTQRALTAEQQKHQAQLREMELLFQEHLDLAELKGNVRQLSIKMSEKRFNVIMDIMQRLDEQMKGVLEKAQNISLMQKASRLFEDARARLLQQVTVEGIFDSDEDEEYCAADSASRQTREVQTDLTPADLGIEVSTGDGKKKGKKGAGGKKAKVKNAAAETLPAIDQEKVRQVQELIDLVYQQLEPSSDSSLGPPTISPPPSHPTEHDDTEGLAFADSGNKAMVVDAEEGLVEKTLVRYLLVKSGHKDGALKTLDDLTDTIRRISGSDMRTAIFARLIRIFLPLPHEITALLVTLKSNCWHARYPELDWAESVRAAGLPLGSKGPGPEARDGVVNAALAHDLVRHTCQVFQLRYDKAREWLAARMLVDRRIDCQVLAVDAVMVAVTTQIDRKVSYLEQVYDGCMPPSLAPDQPATVAEDPTAQVLTADKAMRMLQQVLGTSHVSQKQALDVMAHLTMACRSRPATKTDFSRVCLEFMPAMVASMPTDSQWHPKESVYEPRQPLSPEPPPDEDGGQADEQDATFLTAQTS